MLEARAIACIGLGLCARVEMDVARDGQHHDVAQVGVACAAEVGVAEAHDGAVLVLVAGAVFIHARLVLAVDVVRDSVGVGAELHDAEGRAGSWEGVAHAVGADDGVDVGKVVASRGFDDVGFFGAAEDGHAKCY